MTVEIHIHKPAGHFVKIAKVAHCGIEGDGGGVMFAGFDLLVTGIIKFGEEKFEFGFSFFAFDSGEDGFKGFDNFAVDGHIIKGSSETNERLREF